MDKLFEIVDLKKYYPVMGGVFRRPVALVKALDGIDLDIHRGECLGLVGESGCGKTTTGKAIIRLHDPTGGRIIYQSNGEQETIPLDIASIKPRVIKKMGI